MKKYNVESQVTLKLEDVAKPLPYANESFDFVYSRLVLHYLVNTDLENSLRELYRILKTGHILFVVVRSFDWESEVPGKEYDVVTGMTKYPRYGQDGSVVKYTYRNLQTEESMHNHLVKAGFKIECVKKLEETIYSSYLRIKPNEKPSVLIEFVAIK